jgi:hypothetical protein
LIAVSAIDDFSRFGMPQPADHPHQLHTNDQGNSSIGLGGLQRNSVARTGPDALVMAPAVHQPP